MKDNFSGFRRKWIWKVQAKNFYSNKGDSIIFLSYQSAPSRDVTNQGKLRHVSAVHGVSVKCYSAQLVFLFRVFTYVAF